MSDPMRPGETLSDFLKRLSKGGGPEPGVIERAAKAAHAAEVALIPKAKVLTAEELVRAIKDTPAPADEPICPEHGDTFTEGCEMCEVGHGV